MNYWLAAFIIIVFGASFIQECFPKVAEWIADEVLDPYVFRPLGIGLVVLFCVAIIFNVT
ncbi:hypothetical protein ABIF65_002193 [Bradyrhizobium japonicum]|uniref:Uncharacterized protein n=1 Tax=Bradyrhizobium barranii subsp. barranii TaxID=2823807 RepID=A0A7Z0QH70_9BRAD|nr:MULTISPECIES: hypothetical protein [Bradyrhizobium]MBR1034437.1 hypothetical protein [Bradyrhizobium liaoningense]MBR1071275.1 hypothetical protein [Bradyrhizobium liaoningense]UGX98747.1 hypothetical protein G6321_00027985 [Bradyrhizobium barranii subsp. barranii]